MELGFVDAVKQNNHFSLSQVDAEIVCLLVIFLRPTPQITGGKKQSDEGVALFAVRVNLPCYVFHTFNSLLSGKPVDKSCCSTSLRISIDFAANKKRACES